MIEPTREWEFVLDWNNPVLTPKFNVFPLIGVTITWDDRTWMFHVALGLIIIRFGRVDAT